MTILWDTDPAALETYRFAVGDRVQLVETGQLVAERLAADLRELLVVVGPDIDLQTACDLASQVRLERPGVGVVLLRRQVEVTVLARALRCGIREVVEAEDTTALAAACRLSLELTGALAGSADGASLPSGDVVTVFSAKGGVGKTTIATNLGVYLATSGSRVLLVDLDLAFGDVAISLQLIPSHTASDLIAMSGHIDARGLDSAVTRHESGLDTLCAPDTPADAARIPAAMITELLRVARGLYDFVVVDTPPTFNEHVLAALDVTDATILIATMDVSAVKNLRLVLDTMDQLGYPRQSRVIVLNRSDIRTGLKAADVMTVIGQSVAVCIPNSIAVPASINRGVAIVVDEPEHEVSVALRALADSHVRPDQPTVKPDAPASGSHQPPSHRTSRDRRQLHRK